MHGWEYTGRCMYHIFCFARSVLDMLSKQLTNMCEMYSVENPELSTEEVIARLSTLLMVRMWLIEWIKVRM